MKSNLRELAIIALVALLAAIVLLIGPQNEPIRIFFALPLALFLPGYAIAAAMLWHNRPGRIEQIVIAIALSFAVTLTGGLLLNMLPDGMQQHSWVILLTGVTLVACALAFVRERRMPTLLTIRRIPPPTMPQSVLLVIAMVVAGGAFLIANTGATMFEPEITQLWMLPVEGQPAGAMRIGVTSSSQESAHFRLVVEANGTPIQEWPQIVIAPRGAWQDQITISEHQTSPAEIEALLYRANDPTHVYRRVVWHSK